MKIGDSNITHGFLARHAYEFHATMPIVRLEMRPGEPPAALLALVARYCDGECVVFEGHRVRKQSVRTDTKGH